MPVSFLDLVPSCPTATVSVGTKAGPVEVELTGVSLKVLAGVAKRFPAFVRRLEGGAGSLMEQPEAMAALVAAALGHPGDAEYEARIAGFPSAAVMNLFQAALRLTFPQDEPEPAPLAVPAPVALLGDGLDQTSPLPLSN
jgi:hypothetical protein